LIWFLVTSLLSNFPPFLVFRLDFLLTLKMNLRWYVFAVKVETIWAQFHQLFKYSFYACRSRKHQKILMTWLSFFSHSGSTSVKAVHRTLVKLTPGVNFINVLLAAFSWEDPKRVKRQSSHERLYALLGSACF